MPTFNEMVAQSKAAMDKIKARANKRAAKSMRKKRSQKTNRNPKKIARVFYVEDGKAKVCYKEGGRFVVVPESKIPEVAKNALYLSMRNPDKKNGFPVIYPDSEEVRAAKRQARISKCSILSRRQLLPDFAQEDLIRMDPNLSVYTSSAMPHCSMAGEIITL